MAAFNNKVNSFPTQVMEFLVKFGIPIAIIIVIFPWLKKYLMSMSASNEKTESEINKDREQTENKNPVIKGTKLDQITTRTDIQSAADEIAHHLGTKYDTGSWTDYFNFSYLTENDKEAADLVIYQSGNYNLLERCYYVVTRSRNLTDDLLKYLDSDQLARVRRYVNL